MKAAKIVRPGSVEVAEIPLPQIESDQVLLGIRALGLCGSDLATYKGLNPLVAYPRIPGHEIAAEIKELGSDVAADLKIGDSVTVSPYSACGKCSACRIGRVNCCQYNQTMGVQRDGAATEYIAVPYKKVFKVCGLTDEQISLIEPLSVGWHATNRAEVSPGDIVLVFGCGVIGLGAIIAAAYKKATVVAVDIDNAKLQKAQKLGAKFTINSERQNLPAMVSEITAGYGPHVVIEAVGLPATFRQAVEIVCFAGRVVYVGYAGQKVEYETKLFVSKELDIKGSRNALDSEFGSVIAMLTSGTIDIGPLITHRYRLDQLGQALGFWRQNPADVTKILIGRGHE